MARYKWKYDTEAMTATVEDTVTGGTEVFKHEDLPQNVADYNAIYGDGKRIQDLNSEAVPEGASKLPIYKDNWETFLAGNIFKERGPRKAAVLPAYIEVIQALAGTSAFNAQKIWRSSDKEQQAAFKTKHAKAIAEIEADRALDAQEDSQLDLSDLMD